MDEMFLTKEFKPRHGGWPRLDAKLAAADRARQQEGRLWGILATAMTVALVLVATLDHGGEQWNLSPKSLSPGEVAVADAQVVRVPGTPEGVRYYWMFR